MNFIKSLTTPEFYWIAGESDAMPDPGTGNISMENFHGKNTSPALIMDNFLFRDVAPVQIPELSGQAANSTNRSIQIKVT